MDNQPPETKTVGFKAGERNVFFHILTACNLRCRHCYINTEQHGTTTLPKETIKRWLKLFYEPLKKSNLVFLGGELTLHPNLAACVKFAKEMGYSVTVDSNGFLLNDFLHSTTPDILDYLSFSLDGPDSEVNDPLRGKGVFEVCVSNILKAVAMGYRVSLIYTVSRKNIDHLHRMIPLLTKLGVKRFFIQVIGLRGESLKLAGGHGAQADEALQVSRQKWLDIVPAVARRAAEAGLHVTYPKVFLDEDEQFQCAGEVAENFFIFPNGRVYQCPLCEDYGLHTYTIIDDQLVANPELNEKMMFSLKIAEGCVMNKLLQPHTIEYDKKGAPLSRISCCLLKNEICSKS